MGKKYPSDQIPKEEMQLSRKSQRSSTAIGRRVSITEPKYKTPQDTEGRVNEPKAESQQAPPWPDLEK